MGIFWFGNEEVNSIVLIFLHKLFVFLPTIASALKALENNQKSDQKHEEVDISYLTGKTRFTSDSTNKRESTSTSSSINPISPDIRCSKKK